jgi:two-component system, chemotaxis family, protein-glutamate methylesterase/glutaminase
MDGKKADAPGSNRIEKQIAGDESFPLIVMGASAGGFNILKDIISRLPNTFNAAVLIVWHIAPTVKSILPEVLNRASNLHAAHGRDGEKIVPRRIYVAPPDKHMLVEKGRIRITKGPKENRFRPSIDPLFRSAAYMYGPRVIGIVLSGSLDDGTAGLWQVKHFGGIAIVQDPKEAEYSSMPESALQQVEVDYCLPAAAIAELLGSLIDRKIPECPFSEIGEQVTAAEIKIALEENALENSIMKFGELTPYACPECHGVLTAIKEGMIERYRCHTGHAFSANTLLDAITERVEDSLYNAIRGVDETVLLLNHMGDHFAERNETKLAAMYFQKAKEAADRSSLMRQAVLTHEQLSQQTVSDQLETDEIRQDEY